VLEGAPGWLLVLYDGDGARQAGTAWIPADAVGPSDPPPGWLMSVAETPLLAGPHDGAPRFTTVPPWTILQVTGDQQNGRVPVFYAGDDPGHTPGPAWVERRYLEYARAPRDSRLDWGQRAGAAGDLVRLTVPYRSQLDGSAFASSNSGPVAVAMALAAFGRDVPTAELRNLANRLQPAPDASGRLAIDVVAALVERQGLRPVDLFASSGQLARWRLEDVRHHLRAGHPVIPRLRYRLVPGNDTYAATYDQFVVITGFEGSRFFYNDPIPGRDQTGDFWIEGDVLERAWAASDAPYAAFAVRP
jgi:hypothetical protein